MDTTVNPADAGNNPPATEPSTAAQANPSENKTGSEPASGQGSTPSEPPANQEHDWKKRFDGVSQDHKQLSEEYQQTIDTTVKLVEKNPDMLDSLAETNPKLADKVSKKLYDKSYDSYRKDKELEELKTSDPDRYAQEKRLRKIEIENATRTEEERKSFLKSKGIKDNEFDPAYQKVKTELETLNPQFVEDNPTQAWEKAYQLAFPTGVDSQKSAADANLASNTSKPGGSSAVINHGASKLTPEAQAFKDKMSTLTGSK